MRIVELSNHPGGMLRDIYLQRRTTAERAQSEYDDALARHHKRVKVLRDQREQARARRRWLAWLRLSLAARGAAQRVPRKPVIAAEPTGREEALKAGVTGEQVVVASLRRAMDDDWILLRGYRNHRGEIDSVLLGPRGLFAIEVKHRNATVHVSGDDWQFDKYDRYGNVVERGRIADRRGRSPSVQLNEPASELERFLRSRGQPVTVERIVMLTHPRSQLGRSKNLTVNVVTTSTDQLVRHLNSAPVALGSQQLAQLEQLIVRDHNHHESRRSLR